MLALEVWVLFFGGGGFFFLSESKNFLLRKYKQLRVELSFPCCFRPGVLVT